MKQPPICYIAGALPLSKALPLNLAPDDLLIAADGGHLQLAQRGITPHIIVGDFDSSSPPDHPNLISLPVEKDDTDMGYAIKLGQSRSHRHFVLLGGLGGLLDHTVANLQHLHHLSQSGCNALLVGNGQRATVLTDGSLALQGTQGARCSVFALGGDALGVTLQQLHYQVENITLSPTFPLGVSNAFTSAPAQISVEQGSLLLIWESADSTPLTSFFTP